MPPKKGPKHTHIQATDPGLNGPGLEASLTELVKCNPKHLTCLCALRLRPCGTLGSSSALAHVFPLTCPPAFKQSPPAIPALGTNVKKRRHGDEDMFYMHVSSGP